MYLNSPGYFHYSERLRNRAATSAVRPLKYLIPDRSFAVGTRPEPCRPTFCLAKKGAIAKYTNFALDGDNRFMGPSWVRAHGLIFGKVYIVWVWAPRYRPLSCRSSRIRENRSLKINPNFVTLLVKVLVF